VENRGNADLTLFALMTELFYEPRASLSELAGTLNLGIATVKRLIKTLRDRALLRGRAGMLHLDLSRLRRALPSVSSALVLIEVDIQAFHRLRGEAEHGASLVYSTEEGMLDYLKLTLPTQESFRHRVLVESAHIIMGDPAMANILVVHAENERVLFDYVRYQIEPCDGLKQTRTLMIADSR